MYSDGDFILQSEYRESFKNSDLIADFSFNQNEGNPNGINPRLACILSKYAGQSNKTNFFGLFELNDNTI